MLLNMLILVFATWRLTSIINREFIAWPLRKLLGATRDVATGLESYPDTVYGYLISCFKCLSVWMALLVLIVWLIYPPILYPLALSGAALLLERYM